jgi:hypothetical protein
MPSSTYTDVVDQDVKAFSFQLFFHFGCSTPNTSGFNNFAVYMDDLFARSINNSSQLGRWASPRRDKKLCNA